MDIEGRKAIYAQLAESFPEDTIERTRGAQTGKGYDTTGIKYQYVVNRLNEVLGVGCFRTERKMTMRESVSQKGRPVFEASCELRLYLGEWTNSEEGFVIIAEAIADGGHKSFDYSDALKGAYTNAFKKAAAFFGVGRQAYEGSLDDDNVPGEIGDVHPNDHRPVQQPQPQYAPGPQAPPPAAKPSSLPQQQSIPQTNPGGRIWPVVPAGRDKGTPIDQLSDAELISKWEWYAKRFSDKDPSDRYYESDYAFVKACRDLLALKRGGLWPEPRDKRKQGRTPGADDDIAFDPNDYPPGIS